MQKEFKHIKKAGKNKTRQNLNFTPALLAKIVDRHAVTKMHFAYSLLPSGTLQVLQVCLTTSTLAVKKV